MLIIFNGKKHDTTRFKAAYKIAKEFVNVKPDSALFWFQKTFSLVENFLKEKRNKEELKSTLFIKGSVLIALGNMFSSKGKFELAIDYYTKSLEVNQRTGNKKSQATTWSNIGLIYAEQGNYSGALDCYHKALTLAEETNNKTLIPTCYVNIGNVYLNSLSNYKEAINFYEKGLKKLEGLGDAEGEAYAYSNIGVCLNALGDTSGAVKNFRRSLKIREEAGDKTGLIYSYTNFGNLYLNSKNFLLAGDYFNKTLSISREIGNPFGEATALNDLGIVYLELKDVSRSISYGNQAMEIAKKNKYLNLLRDAALILKKNYALRGDAVNALKMYELYITERDSIDNMETRKDITRKDLQFTFAKKEAADSVKNMEEKRVTDAVIAARNSELKQEKTTRYTLYGGLIFVIAVSIFIFNRLAITRKQNKIIALQKQAADKQREEVMKKNEIIEEKQKEILDSIHYAKRIQTARLTSEMYIERNLNKMGK